MKGCDVNQQLKKSFLSIELGNQKHRRVGGKRNSRIKSMNEMDG